MARWYAMIAGQTRTYFHGMAIIIIVVWFDNMFNYQLSIMISSKKYHGDRQAWAHKWL